MKILRAEATYTGGGIYIYTGQLATGEFFFSDDETADDCIYILDCDPYKDLDRISYADWQNEHTIYIVTADEALDLFECILKTVDMIDYDRIFRLDRLHAYRRNCLNF